ncbi:protein white-like isoform X2 [Oscarella lobularis]|uniref:protein white-like isoform X2 n=1 Tax=Oscarella lobularis TaxID=121494 RepID=UPI0033137EF3
MELLPSSPDFKLHDELIRQLEEQREMELPAPVIKATLSWTFVRAVARSPPSLRERMRGIKQGKEKHILRNVSGMAEPGQLIALMGASGSGKTTLLNILAGRGSSSLRTGGSVLLNGLEVFGMSLGGLVGYVQQEDLFVGTLTVHEHLRFYASLRMRSDYSKEETMARVHQVMGAMGLNKCKDTKIGILGKIKGISGGEKKRLAVASEVLTNPSILFTDEPTSGLDSFMAESVVHVLQKMAASGCTIICTIHQPSSEVFALFDRLILLAEGRVAYCGSAGGAKDHFERCGYACPQDYNPADFYIHTLAIVPGEEEKSRDRIEHITEAFVQNEKGATAKDTVIEDADSTGSTDDAFATEFSKNALRNQWYKAPVLLQIQWVLWRSWLSVIRDSAPVKVRLGQALVVALMAGLMYFQADYDQKRIHKISCALWFVVLQLSMSSVTAVHESLPLEIPLFLRDHKARLYRTTIFYISKTLAELPFAVAQVIIFGIVAYLMIGLNNNFDKVFSFVGICLLIALTGSSFGYLVSVLSPSPLVASAIGPTSYLPFLFFGGFFIRPETVPVFLRWIQSISWFYYGFEALMINEWAGSPLLSKTSSFISVAF